MIDLRKNLENIEITTETVLRFFLIFWIVFGVIALFSSYLWPTSLTTFSGTKFENIFWLVSAASLIVVWRELYRVRSLLERVSLKKYNPIYKKAREHLGL